MANLLDNFTATDGTNITAHVSDTGQTWSANAFYSGTATINSNAVSSAQNLKNWINSWTPDAADYEVTVKIDITDGLASGTTGIGPALRVQNGGLNGYGFLINSTTLQGLDMEVAFFGAKTHSLANGSYYATIGVIGTSVYCRLQRISDGLWLNSSLAWVAQQASIITATRTTVSAAGKPGVWLCAGSASTPPTIDSMVGRPNTGLTVTAPVPFRLFQRDPDTEEGVISIAGTYTGSPTAIEASWNGGAYTTIDAAPAGGTFSGTLAGTGGQGTLTVRWTNDTSVSATVAYVGIGDWYAIAGQSNAVGDGNNNQAYSHATLKAVMYTLAGAYAELADPFGGNGGSCWLHTATALMAESDIPVGFNPSAADGSSITTWQDGEANFENMVTRVEAVGGCRGVLFWQWETDGLASMSTATYASNFDSFVDATWDRLAVPVIPALPQSCSSIPDADEDDIRAAFLQVAASNPHVPATVDLADVVADDGLHVQIDAKLEVVGELFSVGILGGLFEPTINVTAPAESSIHLEGNSVSVEWLSTQVDTVDILLSIDGGSSYPITLVSGTPSDGSYSFAATADHVSATVKIKVRSSVDALLFDESDAFIVATTEAAGGVSLIGNGLIRGVSQ